MGGIAGVFAALPAEVAVERVRAMVELSPHRGQATIVTAPGGAVAVQSNAGDGSVWLDRERIVAIHGYVGNLHELLQGPAVSNEGEISPARWLAAAYGEFGEQVFGRLRGEFAVLIYDVVRRSVTLVRDVPGLRPLHVGARSGVLVVASDARQVLIGSELPRRLDGLRLAHWLANVYQPLARSFLAGVSVVLPGRINVWDVGDEPRMRCSEAYWQPPPEEKLRKYEPTELALELRAALTQAVTRAIPARPFAVAVSGGLDSAGLWGLLDLAGRGGNPEARRARAYSIVFPDRPYDESDYIRLVHEFGPGEGVTVDGRPVVFAEGMAYLAENLDYPAVPTLLHLGLLTRAARADGRTSMMLGSGGNEWLAGNIVYLVEELRAGRVLTVVRDVLRLQLPPGLSRRRLAVSTVRQALAPHGKRERSPKAPTWLSEWAARSLNACEPSPARQVYRRGGFASNRERMLTNLAFHQSGALLGREQYAALAGVELRHPYFDLDVLNVCFRLPARAFLDGVRLRHLQRSALADVLPPRVRDRVDQSHLTALVSEEMGRVVEGLPRRARGWRLAQAGIVTAGGLDRLLDRYYDEQQTSGALVEIAVAECFANACSDVIRESNFRFREED